MLVLVSALDTTKSYDSCHDMFFQVALGKQKFIEETGGQLKGDCSDKQHVLCFKNTINLIMDIVIFLLQNTKLNRKYKSRNRYTVYSTHEDEVKQMYNLGKGYKNIKVFECPNTVILIIRRGIHIKQARH